MFAVTGPHVVKGWHDPLDVGVGLTNMNEPEAQTAVVAHSRSEVSVGATDS